MSGNPGASRAARERLMRDRSDEMRAGVALNASEPDLLEKLSRDRSAKVRSGVPQNDATPDATVERLAAEDPDSYVRGVAANALARRRERRR